MHPLIETYLDRVATRLKKLPPREKEQQLQEISLHLQSLIAYNKLQGLSETDAIHTAFSQFGEPSKIGRDIEQQIVVGHKTSVINGLVIGAIAGVGVLVYFWSIFFLHFGTVNLNNVGLGSFAEKLIEAAFAGAAASLVGRHFTWRYLSRPALTWPLFNAFSQIGTVVLRTMGTGILCGAIGGAIFGFINTVMALLDSHSTVTLVQEMVTDVLVHSMSSSISISLIAGFAGALISALRQTFGRKVPRQWA